VGSTLLFLHIHMPAAGARRTRRPVRSAVMYIYTPRSPKALQSVPRAIASGDVQSVRRHTTMVGGHDRTQSRWAHSCSLLSVSNSPPCLPSLYVIFFSQPVITVPTGLAVWPDAAPRSTLLRCPHYPFPPVRTRAYSPVTMLAGPTWKGVRPFESRVSAYIDGDLRSAYYMK